jgi:hypothetical protein
MTRHRASNLFLVTVIAAVLSAAHLLDEPSTPVTASADLRDATQAATAHARKLAAATLICGEQEAVELPDGAVQCVPQRHPQAITAALAR